MIKGLGSALICGGSFWCWWMLRRERRCQQRTLEHLLRALHQLRESVRMVRIPLPELLEQLAEEEAFFGEVLRELRRQEGVAHAWRAAEETLSLPPESRRAWQWLGRQLAGDERHVVQAVRYTEEVLERQYRQMAEQQEEAERRLAAMCFSVSAMLVVLLL